MSMPPSVMKIRKDNLIFESSVDRCSYTIKELSRRALRDVGRLVRREFRKAFYSHFKKRTRRVGENTEGWNDRNEYNGEKQKYPFLQIGIKPGGWYGMYQEIGTEHQPKLALLSNAVLDNIDKIVLIESQYLSALEDEAKALALMKNAGEGGGDED